MAIRADASPLKRLGFLLLMAGACRSPEPRPLAYGVEQCSHCHMTLADPRFSAELVTTTGRVIPFDDIGCLATFLGGNGIGTDQISSLWVSEFFPPHRLLAASSAVFLRSDSLHTPMDHGIAAVEPGARADSLHALLGGEVLSWEAVLARLRSRATP